MKLEPSSTWGSAAWTGREWILQVFITRDGSPWTIDTDFVLKRWDPVTGHPRFRLDLAAPPERKRWAYTCALLPNERQIVVGGNDGDLSLHDIATGACLWNLEGTGERIRGRARHVAGIAVSRDGSFLVSAAVSERPPSLRVVDVQTGRERRRIEIDCGTQLALFPDAAHVLVDGQSVHAIETGEAVFRIPGFADIGAVSPDGLWIVNGSRDGALACWEVAKLRAGGTEPKWKSASRDDYPFPINRMAISRDGIVLFASSATGIATWRMGDGGRTGNIPFT